VATIRPLLEAYVGMCEAGIDVNVALLTAHRSDWNHALMSTFKTTYHCARTNSPIGLQVNSFNTSLGIQLAGMSRAVLRDNVDKYDVFIYQEDDMVVDSTNILRYVEDTNRLHNYYPSQEKGDGFDKYMIGFFRVFQHNAKKAFLIEKPMLEPICMSKRRGGHRASLDPEAEQAIGRVGAVSEPYIVLKGNTHQGMFILTQQQLRMLDSRCNFFNQNNYKTKREYFSSFSIFNEKSMGVIFALEMPLSTAAYCKVVKVVPAAMYLHYGVKHLTYHGLSSGEPPQHYLSKELFLKKKYEIEKLDCWKDQVLEHDRYLNHTNHLIEEENRLQAKMLNHKEDVFFPFHDSRSVKKPTSVTAPSSTSVASPPDSLSVLAIILADEFVKTLAYLAKLTAEYVTICEAGFDVNIVLLNLQNKADWYQTKFLQSFAKDFYCRRIQGPIGLQSDTFNASVGVYAAGRSRDILRDNAHKYDLFIVQEHDMLVTLPHLTNYIHENKLLESYDTLDARVRKDSFSHMAGFLRYYSLEGDLKYMVEEPLLMPMCLVNATNLSETKPYVAVSGNTNQGVSILTKDQLKMLKKKCDYFNQVTFKSSPSYFSSFGLFGKPHSELVQKLNLPKYLHAYCHMRKVIPAENYLQYSIEQLKSRREITGSPKTHQLNNFFNKKLFSKRRKALGSLDCWKEFMLARNRSTVSII